MIPVIAIPIIKFVGVSRDIAKKVALVDRSIRFFFET